MITIRVHASVLAGLALAVVAAPVHAQGGPCAPSAVELARSVVAAPPPPLTAPAQRRAFDKVVSALRGGDVAAARLALGALVKLDPALGRPPAVCKLLNGAVRQGTLEKEPRMHAALRALAGAGGGESNGGTSADQQRAALMIANIQKQMYDEATRVLQNLKS